jgi:ferric-dicitrate binding protein FerR (iron transport regulator)
MNLSQDRLQYLFEQYFNKTATEAEVDELTIMLEEPFSRDLLFKLFADQWEGFKMQGPAKYSTEKIDDAWKKIVGTSSGENKVIEIKSRRKFGWTGWAAAAVILIVASALWLTVSNNQKVIKPEAQNRTMPSDIAPGHEGAILTLANGSKIVLDNAQDGKITDAALKNGNTVSYQNSDQTKVEFNTLATPKGRQFSLVLPDGTQVWLNAASSITYPTAFIGNERKVSILGEAYFEVSHDASKPFHVDVNGVDVQVLGTHFNINSYSDEEAIKTTLLEGSIKITVAGRSQLVKPGEQAQVTEKDINMVLDADVDGVMAWKYGFFSFDNANITDIMKQLTKWYDVEVVYQGQPKERFSGKIDRNLTLSQVLKGLAETKVHFRIEDGKRLIILP